MISTAGNRQIPEAPGSNRSGRFPQVDNIGMNSRKQEKSKPAANGSHSGRYQISHSKRPAGVLYWPSLPELPEEQNREEKQDGYPG